jgi:aldose 1-epimerase
MLRITAIVIATFLSGVVSAQSYNTTSVGHPDANGKYTIQSRGIRAHFIPYGASISNLFINDTNGVERDIVLGFDNATYYTLDASHPHLGGVPGNSHVWDQNRAVNNLF